MKCLTNFSQEDKMEDKDKLFLIQLIGLIIVATILTVAMVSLNDATLSGFAYMAWGGVLTLLRAQK